MDKKQRQRPKKDPADRPLTRKQEAFVAELIQNPTISQTEAAIRAGYAPISAPVMASETIRKPNVISKLGKHTNLYERVINNTVRDWGKEESTSKRALAVNAAMWAHDKVHGKATQATTSVNLNFTQHVGSKDYGI
jgi:hypothetical protein